MIGSRRQDPHGCESGVRSACPGAPPRRLGSAPYGVVTGRTAPDRAIWSDLAGEGS